MTRSRHLQPAHDRLLDYSRALLELTVRENGQAMETIARVFSEVADLFDDIQRHCSALAQQVDRPVVLGAFEEDCRAASVALREGLLAMQLHDITDQRLAHVIRLLAALGGDESCDIASVLTEGEERALLQLMDEGVPLDEALARVGNGARPQGTVELF
jgi:hypothetical protein